MAYPSLIKTAMRVGFVAALFSIVYPANTMAQIDVQTKLAPKWEVIKGDAVDLGISNKGRVAAVNKAGDVYRYIHQDDRWQRIGQNMKAVAGGAGDNFWGIDRQNNLRLFTGTQWSAIGSGAVDIATDKSGNVYVVTNTKSLAKYDAAKRQWQRIGGTAQHIAVDDDDMVWIITDEGKLARRLDDAWIGLDITATDILTNKADKLLIIKPDGKLYAWDKKSQKFSAYFDKETIKSAAANKGQIWLITAQNKILAQGHEKLRQQTGEGISEGKSGGGSTNEAEVVDSSPITFELVSTTEKLSDLSIGQDGSVFGLTSAGEIRRWSNREDRFYDFPGTLKTILVQASGLPLGIGKNDNLLEHDGEAWRQVNLPEELTDFTLFDDDRILAVNSDDRVIRLSERRTAFELLGTRAQQISAHKDGSYWVVDNVKRVFRCTEQANCTQKNIQAADIAVGPAGSVFVVDNNDVLRRYNQSEDSFEIIAQDQQVSRVALGPRDRPWIINTQGKIYASGYFERDENNDRKLAIKTEATEEVTTEEPNVDGSGSGVQIIESISFDQVSIPTSASGFGNLGSGMLDITVGADDIVLASGYSDPCENGTGRNWVYNSLSRSFNHLDYLKRANLGVMLAVDKLVVATVNGDTPPKTPAPAIPSLLGEWNKGCSDQSLLLTYVSSVFDDPSAQASQNFDGAVFTTPLNDEQVPDLDYAADGYVLNIAPNDELEIFKPETADDVGFFDSIDFMRVGVGKTHKDLWVVSTTYNVYEYVEGSDSFELRSINADDKALDVGVGHDGSVFIVNMSGVLKKWNPTAKRFVKTNKSGVTRVAVDSLGNPIVANFPSSQIVYFGR